MEYRRLIGMLTLTLLAFGTYACANKNPEGSMETEGQVESAPEHSTRTQPSVADEATPPAMPGAGLSFPSQGPTPPASNQPPAPTVPPPPPPPASGSLNPIFNPNQSIARDPHSRIISGLEVVHTRSSSPLQSWDERVPLVKIFAQTPRQVTISNGTVITLDPLAGIEPESMGGYVRMVRGSTLMANAENFIEVSFDVSYPTRTRPNASNTALEEFHPTDYLEFNILACESSGSCRRIAENIPGQIATGSCQDPRGDCVQHFEARIEGAQLPGGVEAHDFYDVEVEGADPALDVDASGSARLCANSLTDCTYSHPFCDAGVCSAIKGGTFFQAPTPADLRALGPRP